MADEMDPQGDKAGSVSSKTSPSKNSKGQARFELGRGGKTIAVHVDRQGFRRLLQTLEKLAATGERQTFEKSGRRPAGAGKRPADGDKLLDKLVFHIDEDGR